MRRSQPATWIRIHGESFACRYDVTNWLGFKLQMQLAEEAGMSQVMLDTELKVSAVLLICQSCQ